MPSLKKKQNKNFKKTMPKIKNCTCATIIQKIFVYNKNVYNSYVTESVPLLTCCAQILIFNLNYNFVRKFHPL